MQSKDKDERVSLRLYDSVVVESMHVEMLVSYLKLLVVPRLLVGSLSLFKSKMHTHTTARALLWYTVRANLGTVRCCFGSDRKWSVCRGKTGNLHGRSVDFDFCIYPSKPTISR